MVPLTPTQRLVDPPNEGPGLAVLRLVKVFAQNDVEHYFLHGDAALVAQGAPLVFNQIDITVAAEEVTQLTAALGQLLHDGPESTVVDRPLWLAMQDLPQPGFRIRFTPTVATAQPGTPIVFSTSALRLPTALSAVDRPETDGTRWTVATVELNVAELGVKVATPAAIKVLEMANLRALRSLERNPGEFTAPSSFDLTTSTAEDLIAEIPLSETRLAMASTLERLQLRQGLNDQGLRP